MGSARSVITALIAFAIALPLVARAQQNGAWLYATNCASCHGTRAQGSDIAPPLIGKSAADIHLMLDTGRMPAAAPSGNEIHHASHFSEVQTNAIVSYVESFSPNPDSSLPRVTNGDAQRGRGLYFSDCSHCHGAAGDGASVGSGNVAPSLMHDSAFQVAEAIRAGPGQMPRFGKDVLSDRDVDDIAAYVMLVQNPGQSIDAGGIPLAHIGPVAEGFIGWLVGIGLLMLFVRSIGTTK